VYVFGVGFVVCVCVLFFWFVVLFCDLIFGFIYSIVSNEYLIVEECWIEGRIE
jgi:hypothetical protein